MDSSRLLRMSSHVELGIHHRVTNVMQRGSIGKSRIGTLRLTTELEPTCHLTFATAPRLLCGSGHQSSIDARAFLRYPVPPSSRAQVDAPASPLPTPNSSRWAIIQFGDYARDMTGALAFTHQQRQQVADTFCATASVVPSVAARCDAPGSGETSPATALGRGWRGRLWVCLLLSPGCGECCSQHDEQRGKSRCEAVYRLAQPLGHCSDCSAVSV